MMAVTRLKLEFQSQVQVGGLWRCGGAKDNPGGEKRPSNTFATHLVSTKALAMSSPGTPNTDTMSRLAVGLVQK